MLYEQKRAIKIRIRKHNKNENGASEVPQKKVLGGPPGLKKLGGLQKPSIGVKKVEEKKKIEEEIVSPMKYEENKESPIK